jgi:hypothetical protein
MRHLYMWLDNIAIKLEKDDSNIVFYVVNIFFVACLIYLFLTAMPFLWLW